MIASDKRTVTALGQEQEREIVEACKRIGVRTLSLVGSAATSEFVAGRSDFDFVVEFGSIPRHGFRDPYFQLRDALRTIVRGPVDLIEWDAVENPLIRKRLASQRVVLYAA